MYKQSGMYIKINLLLLALLIANCSFSQTDTIASFKKGKYKMFVRFIERVEMKKKLKCYSVAINDSGLWMTTNLVPGKTKDKKFRYDLVFVKADNIKQLNFRKNGQIGIGMLLGSIGGAVVGGLIASASEEPGAPLEGLATLAGTVVGFYTGAAIGGVASAQIRRRFHIEGDLQTFQINKENIAVYLPGGSKN